MFFAVEVDVLNQSTSSSQDQPDSSFDKSQVADSAKSKEHYTLSLCSGCRVAARTRTCLKSV